MYLVSARTSPYGTGRCDLWVLAIDTLGDTLWTQTYGWQADEWCYFRNKMNPKGNLMLAGFTSSWGAGGADFWLLEYGYEEVGIEESIIRTPSPIEISASFNRLAYDIEGSAYLILYSADGRKVLCETVEGKGTWVVPPTLATGVYFARLDTGGFSRTARLVIVR